MITQTPPQFPLEQNTIQWITTQMPQQSEGREVNGEDEVVLTFSVAGPGAGAEVGVVTGESLAADTGAESGVVEGAPEGTDDGVTDGVATKGADAVVGAALGGAEDGTVGGTTGAVPGAATGPCAFTCAQKIIVMESQTMVWNWVAMVSAATAGTLCIVASKTSCTMHVLERAVLLVVEVGTHTATIVVWKCGMEYAMKYRFW